MERSVATFQNDVLSSVLINYFRRQLDRVEQAGSDVVGREHALQVAGLRDYASGARVSADKTQMMRDIASRLSEREIVALASYVQGLRP